MSQTQDFDIISIASQVFDDEISGLMSLKSALGDSFINAVNMILSCTGKVIVSGMGKSGHVGNKIAATLASTGTAAFFMHPAEALHGDLGMIARDDLLIAISYSGESDELAAILPLVKRKHVPIIAMTGGENSTLAKLSDCVLLTKIDKEACPLNLAPTTSTTVTLVLGDALAVSLLSKRNFQPEDFAMSHPGGSLGRRLLTKVSDVMHTGDRLPFIKKSASLKETVLEISQKGLGLTAVVDDDFRVIGIVTDGDMRRILDSDDIIDIRTLIASNFMVNNPKTILADEMAMDAVNLLDKHNISGLLAVDENYKLVGAFNLHDLFKAKLI